MKILDTNVCYTYVIDFFAKGAGRPVRVQRHNRDAVVAAVDGAAELGVLGIPDAVAVEMRDTASWAITSAAKAAGALSPPSNKDVADTREKFRSLYKRFGIHDDNRHVERIDDMYAEIWRDGRMNDAVRAWRRVKERRAKARVTRPTIEANGADFLILSTAANQAAQGSPTELLTFDYDFVAFAVAIREWFGVTVVDCGRLGQTGWRTGGIAPVLVLARTVHSPPDAARRAQGPGRAHVFRSPGVHTTHPPAGRARRHHTGCERSPCHLFHPPPDLGASQLTRRPSSRPCLASARRGT